MPLGAKTEFLGWAREPLGFGCQNFFGIPFWLGLVNSPPISEPIVVGLAWYDLAFDPWPLGAKARSGLGFHGGWRM